MQESLNQLVKEIQNAISKACTSNQYWFSAICLWGRWWWIIKYFRNTDTITCTQSYAFAKSITKPCTSSKSDTITCTYTHASTSSYGKSYALQL